MNRRAFVRKSIWGLGGFGALTGLYAWQIEPFWVETVRLKMHIKGLQSSLHGKTLVQISDIHIGKIFDFHYIIDTFRALQKLSPDFVVFTGDYVTQFRPKVLPDLHKVLQEIPKGALGTVGILGNHDYGRNWAVPEVAQKIAQVLKEHDISVLRNESIRLEGLNFIGIDDYWGTNFYPQKAFQHYNPKEATIVLCHNPDVCDLDIWHGYKGWILAGHTHGGQCKPPFLPPPMLPVQNKRYTAGQIDLGDERMLYINRGLGNLYQVRFNVRPEITLFELQAA